MDEKVRALIDEIEMHCPCGARPETLSTHPHVPDCPVAALKVLASVPPAPASTKLTLQQVTDALIASAPDGFDLAKCGLNEHILVDELNELVAMPAPASLREALPCGCIPATISPTCSKKHTGYALMLPARKRPSISVDLEDYQ